MPWRRWRDAASCCKNWSWASAVGLLALPRLPPTFGATAAGGGIGDSLGLNMFPAMLPIALNIRPLECVLVQHLAPPRRSGWRHLIGDRATRLAHAHRAGTRATFESSRKHGLSTSQGWDRAGSTFGAAGAHTKRGGRLGP